MSRWESSFDADLRRWRRVAGPHALPLLGLAVVGGCTALLLGAGGLPAIDPSVFPFLQSGAPGPATLGPDASRSSRLVASRLLSDALVVRFTWAAAEIALAVALLAGLVAGLATVAGSVEEGERGGALATASLLAGAGFAAALWFRTRAEHGVAGLVAGGLFERLEVFERTVLGFGDRAFHDWTTLMTDLTDPLGAAAILALAAGFCALTYRQEEVTDRELGRRFRRLELLLGLSAAVLALFVVEIHALLRWPAVALDPGPLTGNAEAPGAAAPALAAGHLRRIGGGFAAAAGFLFSLALLATAGPAFWRLHREARARAGRGAAAEGDGNGTTANVGSWLEAHGVTLGGWRRVGHALLVLVPALTGVAGESVTGALARALGLG